MSCVIIRLAGGGSALHYLWTIAKTAPRGLEVVLPAIFAPAPTKAEDPRGQG